MKRLKLISIAAALLLVVAPAVMAQNFPAGTHGVGDGFGWNRNATYPQEIQTTNSPAGTVVEPGSQLLYLLDTGVDAVALGLPVGTTMRDNGITAPAFTNFISITNTNPTDGVTIHFRYFDEKCIDVLDFLVVLTCNDTMLINPFDYEIPGSGGINTSQVFFGPDGFPPPIPTDRFQGGRFLLFIVASGAVGNDSGNAADSSPAADRGDFDDPEDLDKFADWLFPFSLTPGKLLEECWAVDPLTIGLNPGAGASPVNDNNLNVFNASAISFNYLSGFHTIAFDAGPGGQRAYGVTAWTRPAVNVSGDLDGIDTSEDPDGIDFSPQDVVGDAPSMATWDPPKEPNGIFNFFDLYNIIDGGWDGDGPLAPKRCVLAGSEEIWLTLIRSADRVLPANYFYLRQDAHGGNTIETNCEGARPSASNRCDNAQSNFVQFPVNGGALDWTIFDQAAVAPVNQFLYGLSVKDDYNGSGNPNNFGLEATTDSAYRMDAAATYYELSIYNNDEDLLEPERDDRIISPPPPLTPLVTRVALRCIDFFRFENQLIPGGSRVPGGSDPDFVFTEDFNTFSVDDLFSLDPAVGGFLAAPVAVNDELGPGWIRFNRIVTRDYWYDATMAPFRNSENYDGEKGTYVTIAKNIIFQGSFGVSWYLPQAATEFDAGAN